MAKTGCSISFQNKEFDSIEEIDEMLKEQDSDVMLQTGEETVPDERPKATPETIAKVKEFLKRIGVDLQLVREIRIGGQVMDANAMADFTEQLIQIVEGKEDVAITEEAMHFAVEIIEQTNPTLFKTMMNQIGRFEIYDTVLYNPVYRQLYQKDGRVDVPMMKKEAIGKLLASLYMNNGEAVDTDPALHIKATDWLDQFIEFLKSIFGKAGFKPFQEAIGIIEDTNTAGVVTEGVALQAANPSSAKQDEVYKTIQQTSQKISLAYSASQKRDVYSIDGKEIKGRVSDLTHEWGTKTFKNNDITKSELDELIEETKKEKGTSGHKDLENIFHRYIDDEGNKRPVPLEMPVSVLNPDNPAFINKLDAYFKDVLDTYPASTRFLSEVRVRDAAKDRAGTMDLVAIAEDGTVDIRDYKFMEIYGEQPDQDVPWYKKTSINIQIGEYKRILKQNYGVTKFGKTMGIPIRTKYTFKNYKTKEGFHLKNIIVGKANPKDETDLSLVPVSTKDQTTGNAGVDKLIKQLNELYERLKKEKVQEGRRDVKIDKLNSVERAIRTLQVQGKTRELLIIAEQLINTVEKDIATLKDQLENDPNAKLNDISGKILENKDFLSIFENLDSKFKAFDVSDEDRVKIEAVSRKARDVSDDVKNGLLAEAAEAIGNGYNIRDMLKPEMLVKSLQRNFRSLSQAMTKPAQVFYKMVNRISKQSELELSERAAVLEEHKKNIEKVAKKLNISTKDVLKKLLAVDSKGRWKGKLIGRYDAKFYKGLEDAAKNNDVQWIRDNIDIAAYEEWYKEEEAKTIKWQADQIYDSLDPENNKAEIKKRVDRFKRTYDISNPSAFSRANDQFYKYPLEKWQSKEYQEISKEPALIEFYQYWRDTMKESTRLGMIEAKGYSSFVPNIRRSLLDKMLYGDTKNKGDKTPYGYLAAFAMHPDSDSIDTITGKPVSTITPRYVYSLGKDSKDEKDEKYVDFTNKSDDLFSVMYLWNDEMIKFKLRNDIEAEARLLLEVERGKDVIRAINKRGEEELGERGGNAPYLENFMNYSLYDNKYIEKGDFSAKVPVGKYVGKINDAFEKTLGFRPLPKPEEDFVDVSASKTIKKFGSYFQMKVLGGNLPSALTNFLGGTTNTLINSGKFIDAGDIAFGQLRMMSGKFSDKEGKHIAGLLDYFLPLTEDEKVFKGRDLSVNNAVANLSTDALFWFQRQSERFVQIPVFIAFTRNTMVENGELVNIREFVRKKNDYGNKYQLSIADRKALDKKIEDEIKELQETRSLIKTTTVVNDRLVIPGIDRLSPTVYDFKTRIEQFTKDALGNMDPQDIYQYRMSVLTSSAMMFKNWIPRMADKRFGELRWEVGKDDWEYGRYRMMSHGLLHNIAAGTGSLIGIMSGKESLIEKAKKLYIVKKAGVENPDQFMNEAQFVDMYVDAVTGTIQEVLTFMALLAMMWGLHQFAPDDDDAITKGSWKYALRLADRARDELSFFYNPMAMSSIANGSVFPALGAIIDLEKFAINAMKDLGYTIIGDEAGQNKTKTSKYLFKALPITKEITTYLGLFSNEIANEYGLSTSTKARRN